VPPGNGHPDQYNSLMSDGFGVAEIRDYIRDAAERRALALSIAERALDEIGSWAGLAYLLDVDLFTLAEDGGTSYSTIYRLLQARDVPLRSRGAPHRRSG
jgi:hypothetical protein